MRRALPTLLRHDDALSRRLIEFAEEGITPRFQRPETDDAARSARNDLLNLQLMRLEFLRSRILIVDLEEDPLAGRHMQFSRDEDVILDRDIRLGDLCRPGRRSNRQAGDHAYDGEKCAATNIHLSLSTVLKCVMHPG